MYTYDDIESRSLQLKAWVAAFPPMKAVFEQAVAQQYGQSECDAVLTNAPPLQAEDTQSRLKLLSQERAGIIYDEIDASLSIALASLSRSRMLLRDRLPVYQDEHIQACSEDIFDHLGYDAPCLDDAMKHLTAEQRQGQVGFHLARARGFLSAARSFDIGGRVGSPEMVMAKLVSREFDHARTSRILLLDEPLTGKEETEFFSYAPALPKNIRQGFGQTSFDLGDYNMSAGRRVLARLKNTVSYLSLIDRELIPKGMGDERGWTSFKRIAIEEGQNSLDQAVGFFNRSHRYFNQSIHFVPG